MSATEQNQKTARIYNRQQTDSRGIQRIEYPRPRHGDKYSVAHGGLQRFELTNSGRPHNRRDSDKHETMKNLGKSNAHLNELRVERSKCHDYYNIQEGVPHYQSNGSNASADGHIFTLHSELKDNEKSITRKRRDGRDPSEEFQLRQWQHNEDPPPRPTPHRNIPNVNESLQMHSIPVTIPSPRIRSLYDSTRSSRKDSSSDRWDRRSYSAMPISNSNQRSTLTPTTSGSSNGLKSRPVIYKPYLDISKDSPTSTTSIFRKFPFPQNFEENGATSGFRLNEEIHETGLSREDSFFEKVLNYEMSKKVRNSNTKEDIIGGHVKTSSPVCFPEAQGIRKFRSSRDLTDPKETRIEGCNGRPQSSTSPISNSFGPKSQTPPIKMTTLLPHNVQHLKSPNYFSDNDPDNGVKYIHDVIIPSKNGEGGQSSTPKECYLKTTDTNRKSWLPTENQQTPSASRLSSGASPQIVPSRPQTMPTINQDSLSTPTRQFSSPIHPFTLKQIEKRFPSSLPNEEKLILPTVQPRRSNPRAILSAGSSHSPASYSDKKVIIMDMGHYYVRVGGLHGQPAEPDLCLPNSIGVTSKGLLFGDEAPQVTDLIANQDLGNTTIISPLRLSQITVPVHVKGVPIQKMFFQNIMKRLNLTGKDYKLLLCLPTRASALRPHFLDYFLGTTSKVDQQGMDCFQAVAIISAFRAALQTAKVSTSLIIFLSADLEIIPIAEGALLEHGRSTMALYGETALRFFMEELVNGGVNLTEKEIDCFGHYIYQKAAFIENHKTTCKDVIVDFSQYAPYPLDKCVKVPAELRRKASDALLRPENALGHDGELPPFKQLLGAAIQSCDLDLRNSICSNVVIIGEFAGIEGFRERMEEEIHEFVPEGAHRPNVQVAPNATECVYEGATLLTALLQGPNPPPCPWFRFLDDLDWSTMRQEANSTGGASDTRLLSRLNKDCVWP